LCFKSYEAQLRAVGAGIKKTYAFDLGIPGWAEKYPEKTILLGKPLSKSEIKWIPKPEFKKKCLTWKDFMEKAAGRGVTVIDTRDYVQKGYMMPLDENALSRKAQDSLKTFRLKNKKMLDELSTNKKVVAQPFDMLLKNVIGNRRYKYQTLLIFDQVGKQVRWLMYHLETAGHKEYYFLSKGASGVIGMQAYGKM
jgi:hypothetical protein